MVKCTVQLNIGILLQGCLADIKIFGRCALRYDCVIAGCDIPVFTVHIRSRSIAGFLQHPLLSVRAILGVQPDICPVICPAHIKVKGKIALRTEDRKGAIGILYETPHLCARVILCILPDIRPARRLIIIGVERLIGVYIYDRVQISESE